MYKRILVAVDGSIASNLALDQAINLARSTGSQLRLVHVVNELVPAPDLAAGAYYQQLVEALQVVGKKTLDHAKAIVRERALEPSSILIETMGRRVAEHIVEQARDWPADLIVMGTHGRRGIARLVMGSDAELVLRTSPVPVLLVRSPGEST